MIQSRRLCLLMAALVPAVESFVTPVSTLARQSSPSRQADTETTVAVANNDDLWYEDSSSDKKKNPKPNLDGSEIADLTRSNNNNNNKKKKEETSPFLQGEELKKLRSDLASYRENLKWATAMDDQTRMESLKAEIETKQMQDPEVVYKKAQALLAEAATVSRSVLPPTMRENLIQYWTEQAALARDSLPRFQMEGLWLGNYKRGPELVNITYVGDTLVATKVTGDDTVPRGEISFSANLSPPPLNTTEAEGLSESASPPQLSSSSSSSSSSPPTPELTILERKYGESIFPGLGQLSKPNYRDSEYIAGVFIVYDSHRFSFSWVPSEHHVFFVRPSPLETLRLLRDVISDEDEVENMREHLTRCYDLDSMTPPPERRRSRRARKDPPVDSFRRIHRQSDLEVLSQRFDADSTATSGSIFQFWRASKWRKYIDRVLGNDEEGLNSMQ